MPTDPDWQFADSYRLIARTQELAAAGRVQVAQSRAIIAESRRILAAIESDSSRGLLSPRWAKSAHRRPVLRLVFSAVPPRGILG
jgi:hypothetical protein